MFQTIILILEIQLKILIWMIVEHTHPNWNGKFIFSEDKSEINSIQNIQKRFTQA